MPINPDLDCLLIYGVKGSDREAPIYPLVTTLNRLNIQQTGQTNPLSLSLGAQTIMTLLANQHFTMNIERHDTSLDIHLTTMATLRRRDLELIAPAIARALHDYPDQPVNALVDIRTLEKVSLPGLFEEIKLASHYRSTPATIVIIGSRKWHKLMARLISMSTKGKVKYCDSMDVALSSRNRAEEADVALSRA